MANANLLPIDDLKSASQDFIESIDARIFSIDTNYRYVFFNRNQAKMMKSVYGVDIEIGMSMKEAMKVDIDWRTAKINIDHVLEGKKVVTETYLDDPGLTREYFEIVHYPLQHNGDGITGVGVFSRNVTERKKAELFLRDSHDYLAQILDSIADPVFVKNERHQFIYVNEAECKLTGHLREEIIGKTDLDFFPKEQVDVFWKQDDLVFGTGNESTNEEQITHPDGTTCTIVTKKSILRDKAGRKNVVGVVRDISERKKTEDKLRQLLRAVEQSPVSIVITDLTGAIEYVNPKVVEVTGYSADELVGKNPRIFQSSDKEPEAYKELWEAISPGKEWRGEFHNRKKDGQLFWEAATISPVRDSSGRITNFVAVKEDITEWKSAKDAIALQASLLNQVRNAVIATDLSGRVIYWNKFAETMYGWKAEEATGKPIETLIVAPQSLDSAVRIFEMVKKRGHWEGEYVVARKDGSVFAVHVVDVLIKDDRGEPSGVIGVSIDISERLKAQDALMESENRFRAIFHNAAIGIALIDADGKIIGTNPSLQRTLGYDEEELQGIHFSGITHPADVHSDLVLYEELTQEKRSSYQMEKRYIRKDGETIWARLTLSSMPRIEGVPRYAIGMVEEISERKAAEKALEEAEEKYRSIFENATQGICQISPAGGFMTANPAMARILGYESPGDLIAHVTDIAKQLFKEENDRLLWNQLIEEHHAFEGIEIQLWRKDGSVVWVSGNAHAVLGENNVLLFYEGTLQDISERKKMEETLRESDEKFRLVFEHAFDGISIFEESADPEDSRIVDCNPRYAEIAGRSREELLAIGNTRHYSRSLGTSDRETIGGGPAFRGSFTWNRPDTRENIVEFTGVPIEMRGKKFTIGIDRDVTEQKLSVERLRQSEEQFRLISENVGDMIAVMDTHGKRLYNSPSYRDVLGDPASLRGTDALSEIHPEDREKIKKVFEQTVRTGIGQRSEYRFLLADGSTRNIESQGSVIKGEDGTVAKVVVVSRDVTEQKQLEQQFLRAQRMESIGTLASGIAHDLNNVLAPIMMGIEIIRAKVSDPDAKNLLNTMESSAKRGSSIVKQVLAFGRGLRGEQISLQIKHVIFEVAKIVEGSFPKSIEMRTDVPRNLWTVMADPTQMHQVLLNVCVNARDAMPHGGTLTVSAANTTLDEQYATMNIDARAGDFVVLTITDTGMGMSAATQEKIFDPFFTTKEIGMGTGLGLSTTLGIVKSHKGFVTVQSEIGRGTTLKIYIPAAGTGPGVETFAQRVELPMGKGELILIIDDEAAIREITRETLQIWGYGVLTACDGAEGVALYVGRQNEIKAVITDMMMPIMDGTAAIHALQILNPEVKIIAVSGLATNGPSAGEPQWGVQAFLTKPYSAEKLLVTLAGILGNQ